MVPVVASALVLLLLLDRLRPLKIEIAHQTGAPGPLCVLQAQSTAERREAQPEHTNTWGLCVSRPRLLR
jgi:hypothetical protein